MARERTPAEQEYRATVNHIAFSMLIFEALFTVFGIVISVAGSVLDQMAIGHIWKSLIRELGYGVLYACVFVIPAFCFYLFSQKQKNVQVQCETLVPAETALYLLAGLAVIFATAQINAALVGFFSVSPVVVDNVFGTQVTTNTQLVLTIVTTALVPAFVEEFLFRGVVLSHLLRYGKTTAVLFSALLFGIMHQNAAQLLYAVAAGLVLGFIYLKTRSIWPCVLLHFFNNFLSLIQAILAERLPPATAYWALAIMQGMIFLFGVAAAVLLILRQKADHSEPPVRAPLALESDEAARGSASIAFGRRVQLFFSAPMIVFLAVCVLMMFLPTLLTLLLF
ncbi:MAG: CPBP family intramembrane metalloprotease [Ruminococcaceae bacterium]|nr:CPBP family intramembrane metalloprotease [Oscillospiraceae bacterium]